MNEMHEEAVRWVETLLRHAKVQITLMPMLTLREAELMLIGAQIQEQSHNNAKMNEIASSLTGQTAIPLGFGSPQWTINTMAKAVEGLRLEKEERMKSIPS